MLAMTIVSTCRRAPLRRVSSAPLISGAEILSLSESDLTLRLFMIHWGVCPRLGGFSAIRRTSKHMAEKLLTTREVADRLGVDPKTVLRYLKSGRLKGPARE